MTNYKKCSKCLMDESDKDFVIHSDGCSYCIPYRELSNKKTDFRNKNNINEFIVNVKAKNRKSKYDCIVGVSGGVDSSWVLVKAKEYGLNPLAVHMDNGWNSELAQNNINNLIRILEIDLYTYVINWNEYRELMNQLFDSDVIDVELLHDNAMLAVNYMIAKKFGIKTILSGMNTSTEGMAMPKNWNWFKYDKKQIKHFSKKCNIPIKTFPSIGTFNFLYSTYIKKITWEHFLDCFDFNKEEALINLEKNYAYKRYPYKHYESVFTRFYQGYILPEKFNVDKRILHLSTLVISGQLDRVDAVEIIKKRPYDDEIELLSDLKYFLKKMKWDENKFNEYISRKEISHSDYPSEKSLWERLIQIKQYIK